MTRKMSGRVLLAMFVSAASTGMWFKHFKQKSGKHLRVEPSQVSFKQLS